MEAAFKPQVNGELDTQNFMKFDEVYNRNSSRYIHIISYFVYSLTEELLRTVGKLQISNLAYNHLKIVASILPAIRGLSGLHSTCEPT